MIAFAVMVTLGVVLLRRRAKRKRTLAGLDSTAPTYSLAPARRWSTNLKDHTL